MMKLKYGFGLGKVYVYAEATCEIPRRVTRQKGTQIIYVFF